MMMWPLHALSPIMGMQQGRSLRPLFWLPLFKFSLEIEAFFAAKSEGVFFFLILEVEGIESLSSQNMGMRYEWNVLRDYNLRL